MATDTWTLSGSYTTCPLTSGLLSADPSLSAPIDETMVLATKGLGEFTLLANTPTVISLPNLGMTAANVLIIKVAVGPGITATLSSTLNANQVIPVDSLLILTVQDTVNQITGLSLLTTSSFQTVVRVFVGQMA